MPVPAGETLTVTGVDGVAEAFPPPGEPPAEGFPLCEEFGVDDDPPPESGGVTGADVTWQGEEADEGLGVDGAPPPGCPDDGWAPPEGAVCCALATAIKQIKQSNR